MFGGLNEAPQGRRVLSAKAAQTVLQTQTPEFPLHRMAELVPVFRCFHKDESSNMYKDFSSHFLTSIDLAGSIQPRHDAPHISMYWYQYSSSPKNWELRKQKWPTELVLGCSWIRTCRWLLSIGIATNLYCSEIFTLARDNPPLFSKNLHRRHLCDVELNTVTWHHIWHHTNRREERRCQLLFEGHR